MIEEEKAGGHSVFDPIPPECERVGKEIIGAAIEVHRHLGRGLLESVYEKALVHELRLRKLIVRQQVLVPVFYKDLRIDGQRLDLLVEPGVIAEVKAVERLIDAHAAQILSYLRSTKLRLGYLINFNTPVVSRGGIKRFVN
ncbi:MAG: GxxExxY protein [Phycisphaerae bacterium]